MKTNPPPAPAEADINRLLARGYRDTSPQFEARWVALKRELRQRPVANNRMFPGWRLTGWFGALGAAAAIAFTMYFARRPEPRSGAQDFSPQLTELLAMDAVLGGARPLLDEENHAALLHLPAGQQPHD